MMMMSPLLGSTSSTVMSESFFIFATTFLKPPHVGISLPRIVVVTVALPTPLPRPALPLQLNAVTKLGRRRGGRPSISTCLMSALPPLIVLYLLLLLSAVRMLMMLCRSAVTSDT